MHLKFLYRSNEKCWLNFTLCREIVDILKILIRQNTYADIYSDQHE